jgi:hypothetical protein
MYEGWKSREIQELISSAPPPRDQAQGREEGMLTLRQSDGKNKGRHDNPEGFFAKR